MYTLQLTRMDAKSDLASGHWTSQILLDDKTGWDLETFIGNGEEWPVWLTVRDVNGMIHSYRMSEIRYVSLSQGEPPKRKKQNG